MPPAKHVKCSKRLFVSPMTPEFVSALASLTMLLSSWPSHTCRTRYFLTPFMDDLYSSSGTCNMRTRSQLLQPPWHGSMCMPCELLHTEPEANICRPSSSRHAAGLGMPRLMSKELLTSCVCPDMIHCLSMYS